MIESVDVELQDVIKKLAMEASMPNTRMNAIGALVELFAKVPQDRKDYLIQNVLRAVMHDKCDEVRVLIAAKMTRIQENVGHPTMKSLIKFVVGQIEKGGSKVK